MRCKTPMIRSELKSLSTISPASRVTKGNAFNKRPSIKMSRLLLNIFFRKRLSDCFSYFFKLKLAALPTTKRNVGKTRSVSVKPCHAACLNGAYILDQLPGVFTITIRAMVIPRSTSRARYLRLTSTVKSIA